MATSQVAGGSGGRTPDWAARAAVLSVFNVDWIQPVEELDDEGEDELAEFIASSCERVVDSSGVARWQIRDTERSRVLARTPQKALRAALDAVAERPDDPVQTALTRFVAGLVPSIDELDAAGLSAELQVDRWTGTGDDSGSAGGGRPGAAEIQSRLDWLAVTEPLDRLTADGFFGRDELLSECRAFVADPPPQPGSGFLIEGIGGSGKSTLLARLIADLTEAGQLVAYLSFDRGWLLDGGPTAIFDEIVRQVGAQRPVHLEVAASIRRQAQRLTQRAKGFGDIASRGSRQTEGFSADLLRRLGVLTGLVSGSVSSSNSGAYSGPNSESVSYKKTTTFTTSLPSSGTDRRLVIVLDTLEELARRDEAVEQEIRYFLRDLTAAIPGVRILAAGRAVTLEGTVRRLAGLAEPEALALLRALTSNAHADVLREVFELVGGNPLSLRLAADILRRTDGEPTRLLAVSEGNVQGQLYSRLLEHIRDPKVRAVAHPGLVVRRITPEIIREVLAGPCGIAPVSEQEAARIFGALRDEATLCTQSRDEDFALVHREDVRAIMLPAIRRDRPATTREIHRAAARYYETRVSGRLAMREKLYHLLMLDSDRDVLDRAWNQNACAQLATVIDEFPPRAQVYVATKVKRLRLDQATRAAADDDQWRQVAGPAARLQLENDHPQAALDLVRERRDGRGRPLLPDIEVEALERLGRVDEALSLAETARREAERHGDLALVRTLITAQARINERLRRWPRAWNQLAGLAVLDLERRARTDAVDDDIRTSDLVVLTSLLRIARHMGRLADSDPEIAALMEETIQLARDTRRRLLTANTPLLRDLAAEVGEAASEFLDLADATMSPESLVPESLVAETTVTPETAVPETVLPESEPDERFRGYQIGTDDAQDYL